MWAFLLVASLSVLTFVQETDKPRVYVTDSQSWQVGGRGDAGLGGGSGGARPQTAEIVKTLNEKCRGVIVTRNEGKANYVLVLEHEGGKMWINKDNKYALYNKDGDSIKSGSTRSLGSSVKEACEALSKDWQDRSADFPR
jgi:hypothetical protein